MTTRPSVSRATNFHPEPIKTIADVEWVWCTITRSSDSFGEAA